jgi:UDP-glucose 4-epimerase
VAKKAKKEGVKHFIFTSSMAIYGNDSPIGDFKPIEINKPSPTNAYGQSKLEADLTIQKLQTNNFNISILRLPMVYGKTSKGNFLKLVKISKKLSIFPKISNRRSVLHINNLSELVRLIIVNHQNGIFYPQDQKYFDTNNFLFSYRLRLGKTTHFIPFISPALYLLGFLIKEINKIYGNKYYENTQSIVKNLNYQIFSIDDLIREV